MDGSFDLSKIINIIAENPQLISMVKGMLGSSGNVGSAEDTYDKIESTEQDVAASTEAEVAPYEANDDSSGEGSHTQEASAAPINEATENAVKSKKRDEAAIRKKRRKELLCALKPYVRKERSKAIDTMLSFTEVLEVLRREED